MQHPTRGRVPRHRHVVDATFGSLPRPDVEEVVAGAKQKHRHRPRRPEVGEAVVHEAVVLRGIVADERYVEALARVPEPTLARLGVRRPGAVQGERAEAVAEAAAPEAVREAVEFDRVPSTMVPPRAVEQDEEEVPRRKCHKPRPFHIHGPDGAGIVMRDAPEAIEPPLPVHRQGVDHGSLGRLRDNQSSQGRAQGECQNSGREVEWTQRVCHAQQGNCQTHRGSCIRGDRRKGYRAPG
mmetsp:Transcript_172114/g.546330  ORF Transcript_172114/g.546330 Transcript_172114/m.546330 type:complete len:239 (-) Transcript_172114:25-741(-)